MSEGVRGHELTDEDRAWAVAIESSLGDGDYQISSSYLPEGVPRRRPDGTVAMWLGPRGLLLIVDTDRGARAVRVYWRTPPYAVERFTTVTRTLQVLNSKQLGWFRYEQDGLRIAGRDYPIAIRPWIDGLELPQYLARRRDWKSVALVDDGLSHAVAIMQAAGIAHGDLHPGNIIVGRDGLVHLVDIESMFSPRIRGLGILTQPPPPFRRKGVQLEFDPYMDEIGIMRLRLGFELLRANVAPRRLRDEAQWLDRVGVLKHLYLPRDRHLRSNRRKTDRHAFQAAKIESEIRDATQHPGPVTTAFYAGLDRREDSRQARQFVENVTGKPVTRVLGALDIGALRSVAWRETVTVVGRVASVGVSRGGSLPEAAHLNCGQRSDDYFAIHLTHNPSPSRNYVDRYPGETDWEGWARVGRYNRDSIRAVGEFARALKDRWVAVTASLYVPSYDRWGEDAGTWARHRPAVSATASSVRGVCIIDPRIAADLMLPG